MKKPILSSADIEYLKEVFATKADMEYLKEVFATKEDLQQFKSDFFDKIDPVLKEIMDNREERTILAHRQSDHTDRIEVLEKIHPQGKHLTAI